MEHVNDAANEEILELYPKDTAEETLAQAKAFEKYFADELEEYEATEKDFETLLVRDHELMEELADEGALLGMAELLKDTKAMDADTIEIAYLNVIDKLYELSKSFHPLCDMGKDRLLAALTLTEEYEKNYRPLLTQVSGKNIAKFAHLLTERYYDEVSYGRKNAIAALMYEGERAYGAGIAVYHFDTGPVTGNPVLRIDYVYVDEDFRQQGVGNRLIGRLMCFAAAYESCPVTAVYVPPQDPDEGQAEDMTVITSCLDGWGFDFSMNYGTDYFIRLSDVAGNENINREAPGVTSLRELGGAGKTMLSRFFKERNDAADWEIAGLPYDYFDKDVSCVAAEGGRISALLLIHSYESGDYRLEYLQGISDSDAGAFTELLCFAYRAWAGKNQAGAVLSGSFTSEEGMDFAAKMGLPVQMRLTCEGILMRPSASEDMTSEQWRTLGRAIGLSDIVTGNEDFEEVFTAKAAKEIRKALCGIAEAEE